HLPRPRPPLDLAGQGRGRLRRDAVHPLLRAGRARLPGDGVARLHRVDAGHAGPGRDPRSVAGRPARAGRGRPGRGHRLGGAAVTPPALEVDGVAFAYPDGHQALYGVSFTVRRGERVALLGPNGAGKTTLVLQLNGVLLAGAGRVVVAGLPVAPEHLREIRRRVGIVFQDPDDQLFMPTVAEDVAFGPANLGLRGAELETRVKGALAAVGMDEHAARPPHHLSFGQRRRGAVGTVLSMEPEILVLDEPSSNLDPAS